MLWSVGLELHDDGDADAAMRGSTGFGATSSQCAALQSDTTLMLSVLICEIRVTTDADADGG